MARSSRRKSSRRIKNDSADLGSTEGLSLLAEQYGLGQQAQEIVQPKKKLSTLQRLSKGLGAFNTAEAVLTGSEKGVVEGVKMYLKNIAQGVGSAVTGNDYEGTRRTYRDVAEKLGVENGIAKFGLGFLGDVLLDPSTYFGGALARAGVKAAGKAGNTALKAVGKVAPQTEAGLRLAGTGAKDAFGRAFNFGYKSSKGAKEDVLTFLSKQDKAKVGLAASNLKRLGTGTLSKSQQEELALGMIAGKRAEFVAREAAKAPQGVFKGQEIAKVIKDVETSADPLKSMPLKGFREMGVEPIVNGKINPQVAIGRISDMTQKLEQIKPGLGSLLKVDPNNVSVDELAKAGREIVENMKLGVDDVARAGEAGREAVLARIQDPAARKVAEDQMKRSTKFASQLDIEDPYQVYFPFLKQEKLEKFLRESDGLRVGSEGYLKQFRNILSDDAIEKNPAKAFFTREAQAVTDKTTRNFLKGFVQRYGKKLDEFDSADDALKSGFNLVREKGRFGKELGYLSKYDSALLQDGLTPEFQTIDMLAKGMGYDSLTSLFKRSVTGLFAPFHVRNYASGHIQNYEALGLQALNPKNMAIGHKIAYLMGRGSKMPSQTVDIGGKTMKFKDVMKPFVDRFSGDTFYNNDFLDAVKAGSKSLDSASGAFSKEALKKTVGLQKGAVVPLFNEGGAPMKVGRAVGQFIEHQQKATAYVTALSQGKNIKEALRFAEAAGFDYRALTRFESQIMRRIVPFYSFTRKNIELQLKTLGENPQRINQVLSFFENMGDAPTEEEKENLPDYIRDAVAVKMGDSPSGLKRYISSFGTPIEQFAQLFGKNPVLRAISQTNPLIKAPVEIGIGKDSFRQRDLKTVYDAREYKAAPQFVKDLLELQPVEKDVLERNKRGKLVPVGKRTVYVADPTKLLIARSLFTSRGVSYLDQVFGGDMEGFTKLLKTTTGVKPQDVDIEQLQSINESKVKRELEDLLTRYGVTRQFTRTYIPKK